MTFSGRVRGFFGLLLQVGLALLYEIDLSALHHPPTGIPKLSVASLPESKSTRWARSGGRRPVVEGFGACAVGVGGPESKMQSESGWVRGSATGGSVSPTKE